MFFKNFKCSLPFCREKMKKYSLFLFFVMFCVSLQAQEKFQLYSTAFKNNEKIPMEYTCDGSNVSPALQWSGVPKQARSLVLLVRDYEAVKSPPVSHWSVFNIPPYVNAFEAGTASVIAGLNVNGDPKYTGPCPPDGAIHNYNFDLYALSIKKLNLKLESDSFPTADQIVEAMQGSIIAEASMIGSYKRAVVNAVGK